MDDPRESSPSGAARLWPLALTVAIFALIFWRIPIGRLREALEGARLLPFLGLMGGFSLCFFAMDTYVLARMIRWFHGPLPYRDLLPVRAVTYLVSIVNTQLAQATLALYIHRRFGAPLGRITSTVAFLILIEATHLMLFASGGMAAFPGRAPAALYLVPLALGALWLLVLLTARGKILPRWAGHSLLHTFRRARASHFLTVLALKGSVFLLSLLVHSRALAFFGIEIPLVRLLTFLPVIFLLAALPVTVAHLGTSQAAWIFFFRDFAPEADLLAYSLASHLTFMLVNGAFGLVFLPGAYADLFVRKKREDISRGGREGSRPG
ncbi:MAG: lysylphosphatidylglycerol synthase domain-containing protein [bacterium]